MESLKFFLILFSVFLVDKRGFLGGKLKKIENFLIFFQKRVVFLFFLVYNELVSTKECKRNA